MVKPPCRGECFEAGGLNGRDNYVDSRRNCTLALRLNYGKLTMNIREWFNPRRTIALVLVLIGSALQIYALIDAGQSYLNGIGIGLLVLGLAIELIGQGFGGKG